MTVKKYDVFAAEVHDQLLYVGQVKLGNGDMIDTPKLSLTLKLTGKLLNSNNPNGPRAPLPADLDEYVSAEIPFWPADKVEPEKMQNLARDLLNIGYTKEEVELEDFLKDASGHAAFDLTGKQLYVVAYPRANGNGITWYLKNFATAAKEATPDVIKAWKRASLGATREAMRQVNAAPEPQLASSEPDTMNF